MDREQAQRALEAEVLGWIARLPLIRRSGLDGLTGAPAEAVDQALDLLRRTGWTEAIGVPFDAPATEHGFVLRPAAVRPFAATFGIDEAALRRTWPVGATALYDCLGRYETTQAATHALVSIADDLRRRGAPVVDARLFPGRLPARSPWPRGIDGALTVGPRTADGADGFTPLAMAAASPGNMVSAARIMVSSDRAMPQGPRARILAVKQAKTRSPPQSRKAGSL